ncbi:MAG: hypothetical protein ACREOZ_03295, partial [Gloeomargaritales cyanobacterium]
MHTSMFGDCVAAVRWIAVCYRHQDPETMSAPRLPSPPSDCCGPSLANCLTRHYDNLLHSVGQLPPQSETSYPCNHVPLPIARSTSRDVSTTNEHLIFDPTSAAPVPNPTVGPFKYSYGVPFDGPNNSTHVRAA